MSFNDLGTQSNECDLNVTNMISHYCLIDTLDENTTSYSEVILERNQIDNEKISKLQPDCVVVFSTTEEEDLKESLLAAKQFNIPIVYIDRQKYLQAAISQQFPSTDTNMDEKEYAGVTVPYYRHETQVYIWRASEIFRYRRLET